MSLRDRSPRCSPASRSPSANRPWCAACCRTSAAGSSVRGASSTTTAPETLPLVRESGGTATVLMGTLAGATSPGTSYSPTIGAEVDLGPDGEMLLPLEPEFEHAALAMSGSAEVDGTRLEPGALLYLGC